MKTLKTLFNRFIYSYLYDYNVKRVLKIFATFFGIIGFLWTLIECFSWVFDKTEYPNELRLFIVQYLKLGLTFIGFLSIYIHRRKRKIEKKFSNTDLTIVIEFCDIFEQEGAIIIPVADTFDNDIGNGLVNPRTLHGQFIEKYYKANVPSLNSEITRTLADIRAIPIQNDPSLKGNIDKYQIGTACPISTNGKYFYLTALTSMKETGNVEILPEYIYEFLSGVWSFIPKHGEYHDVVNIPVIGTGLNRLPAHITRQYIVREIINSFIIASKVQTLCKTLRICLSSKDYKSYSFEDINIVFCYMDNSVR